MYTEYNSDIGHDMSDFGKVLRDFSPVLDLTIV